MTPAAPAFPLPGAAAGRARGTQGFRAQEPARVRRGPGVGGACVRIGSGRDPPGPGGRGLTGFPVVGGLDRRWEEPYPGPMEGEA